MGFDIESVGWPVKRITPKDRSRSAPKATGNPVSNLFFSSRISHFDHNIFRKKRDLVSLPVTATRSASESNIT
jgi:hypothetical protein